MKKIPLVMKVWAGAEPHDMDYITRSIPSLLASRLPETLEVVIYDDASPSEPLQTYLRDVARRDPRVRVIRGSENKGPNRGQQDIYQQIVDDYPDTPYYLNVDDDVIYHRDWMTHLVAAQQHCRAMGLNGIFTALNMPYRPPHGVLKSDGRTYLLKWKQPALNWLISRDLYEDVGPFSDEGIAYDTVYSHWMRLKHYAVICLAPSYVQNIGLLGAYATDDTTTSCDFVGDGEERSQAAAWLDAARYTARRLPARARRGLDRTADRVAPVRWGTEFVHEGRTRDGASVAMFSFDDAARLGWDLHAAARRVEAVQQADPDGAAGIVALRSNRAGLPVWVECDWEFSPNVRECAALNLAPTLLPPAELFKTLLQQLVGLHDRAVAHNKIRQDNVYRTADGRGARLAWLGAEPCPGVDLSVDASADSLARLSGTLNRWATPATRETCAARYLESLAPEIIRGEPASLRADVFAAAAVAVLSAVPPIDTLATLTQYRARWNGGASLARASMGDPHVQAVLARCLATDPLTRPADARETLRALAR